ncbi:TlpA family protein disulfide reductase [Ornithobacterium rhinotracheale]|uniref:TlpA family protein disulfide reductase n=1 Tax=Ornithobacterium rhinotracheale TaxID=28251 RepID=UPI0040353484
MKEKIYLLHILCVLLLSLNTTETLAQTKTGGSTTVSTAKETIVKGIIPELKNQTISIDYIDILRGPQQEAVEVDENGKFSKKLNLYRPQQIVIDTNLKDYYLLIDPGKTLDLNDLSPNQKDYLDKISMFYKLILNKRDPYPNFAVDLLQGKEVYSLPYIRDYERKLDSIKANNLKVIEGFSSKENIQKSILDEFKLYEDKRMLSMLFRLKNGACRRKVSDFDSIYTNENLKFLSNTKLLPDFYRDSNINESAIELCRLILGDYFQKNQEVIENYKKNKSLNQIYENIYKLISKKIKNPKLIQAYFAQNIYNQRTDFQFDSVKPFFDKYITLDYLREPIINKYVAIQKGVLPNINLLEKVKGTKAEKFVQKIFNENKGKYIYLDIWATWCGPCLELMPMLKQIEKDSKSQDIAFVKLCMRSPENKWKEISKQENLDNNNYFADDNLSIIISSALHQVGYPSSFLIAPNGDLITNDFDIRILQAFSKDFDDAFNELKIEYEESKK